MFIFRETTLTYLFSFSTELESVGAESPFWRVWGVEVPFVIGMVLVLRTGFICAL